MDLVTIPAPARSLASVLCVLALAGVLVSPAVPSPPTLVGRVHAPHRIAIFALFSAACGVASVVRAFFSRVTGLMLGIPDAGPGPVSLPLRI